jgi:hypothetical protein
MMNQFGGDFGIGATLGDEPEHLHFTCSQPGGWIVSLCRCNGLGHQSPGSVWV